MAEEIRGLAEIQEAHTEEADMEEVGQPGMRPRAVAPEAGEAGAEAGPRLIASHQEEVVGHTTLPQPPPSIILRAFKRGMAWPLSPGKV